MKQRKHCRILVSFVIVLLISIMLTPIVFANAAEPPLLTIMVIFPPDDLTLSIRSADGSNTKAVKLYKNQKAWEAYYRFFRWMEDAHMPSLEGAVLVVQSNDKNFECLLPEFAFKRYNNLLILNLANESITEDQSPARSILLVSMRVILTLIIEGLIFFAFGYRNKASWIAFVVINLLTQGTLNMVFIGPILSSYFIFGFIFLEFFIFIIEMAAFPFILKEHKKKRAAAYALTANLASLILGCILLSCLPV
ncbi:MAG: hypothetical protein FWF73_02955 [Spirochaetes bacterium]|nr:hypothetical protein [Spirochaetota bacterium]